MSRPLRELLEILEQDTRAGPEDVAALRASLPPRLGAPEGTGRSWRVPLGVAGVAAAAALLAWVLVPGEPVDAPVAAALQSTDSRGHLALGEGLELDFDGNGELSGSLRQPRIAWHQGRLRVSVEPDSVETLSVQTRDAEVVVEGTVFEVSRDLLGTEVRLERGAVTVRCEDGAEVRLQDQGRATCLPTTPGGLLARARGLHEAEGPSDAVLESVRRGLALVGVDQPAGAELKVLELRLRVERGELAEAREAARVYLVAGAQLRRSYVEATARELAVQEGDCDLLGLLAPVDEPAEAAVRLGCGGSAEAP